MSIKLDENWKQKNNLYKCPFCLTEKVKKGICSHIFLKHTVKGKELLLNENFGNGLNKKSPWSKGLNKETDTRLKNASNKYKKNYKLGKYKKPLGKCLDEEKEVERKKKISLKMMGNRNSKGRGTKILYKGYWLRSTWEFEVAKYLDSNSIKWDYEVTHYKLKGNRTYRPDFFIYDDNNEFKKIIEVKGYWYKNNKEKLEEFLETYEIEVEIWDRSKLKELKLIK